MALVCSILNPFSISPLTHVFTPTTATHTRSHCMKLFKFHSRVLVGSNFFTQRFINSWNSLSDDIITSNTVGQFKAKLDKDWELSGYGFEQRLLAQHYFIETTCFWIIVHPYNNNDNNNLYQWIHGASVESICGILSLTDISMCLYMLYVLCTRQY